MPVKNSEPSQARHVSTSLSHRPKKHEEKGSAVQKVFGLDELLLMILNYLSTNDLIKTTRVSKHIYEIIEHDKTLQQKLFMAPAQPVAYFRPKVPADKYRKELPSKFNTEKRPAISARALDDDKYECAIGTPNPLFSENDIVVEHIASPRIWPSMPIRMRISIEWFLKHTVRMARIHKRTNWNDTFICQPPVKEVMIEWTYDARDENGRMDTIHVKTCFPHFKYGVRISQLAEMLRSNIEEHRKKRERKRLGSPILRKEFDVLMPGVIDEYNPYLLRALRMSHLKKKWGRKSGRALAPVSTGEEREVEKFWPQFDPHIESRDQDHLMYLW